MEADEAAAALASEDPESGELKAFREKSDALKVELQAVEARIEEAEAIDAGTIVADDDGK